MNAMKKVLAATVLLCVVSSCSDDFLEVPVQGGVTTASDPNLAEKLVTGVYHSLMQGDSWGNGDVHGFAFISVTNIMSDDADKGSTPSDQAVPVGDIDNFTITPTNKFCETLWSGHYNGIGAANQALAALKDSPLEAARKNQLAGEVRFLRGYLYFNLVRMFGGVPLVLRVPKDANDANSDPAFQTRAAAPVVYDSIARDFQYAIDHLPLKSTASVGHATKGAAQAMLAKAYMYQQKWPEVFTLTENVINSGQYSLVDDYASLWRQEGDNSRESVFEIQTGKFNNANLKIDNYTACQGPRVGGKGGWDDLGWGFNNPSSGLVNAYETGDLRKAATVISIDNSGTYKGTVLWDGFRVPSSDSVQNLFYNYKAYTSRTKEQYANTADKDRPKNIKVLRYADVLLMYAEAAIHTGQGDAVSKINLLRERATLLPKASVSINDVWNERRVELAMEHDRFWDLVRQGRAAQIMQSSGKTNFVLGKNEVLPIPNSQILLSGGKLKQNTGY
jgi:starch-binding outer membrane protein, SusD/RagB family